MIDIKMTTSYRPYSEILRETLELEGSPVAIAISREPPSRIKQATRGVTVCMMLQIARRGSTFWASGKQIICGARAHLGMGKTPIPFIEDFLVNKEKLFSSKAAAKRLLTSLKNMAPQLGNYLIFSPLEKAEFIPDLVVFVATPAQVSRILFLDAFETGEFELAHQEPLCSGSIAMPITTHKIGISFLDISCRFLGKYRPEEMTVGVPFDKLLGIIENIGHSSAGSAKQSNLIKFAGNILRKRVPDMDN